MSAGNSGLGGNAAPDNAPQAQMLTAEEALPMPSEAFPELERMSIADLQALASSHEHRVQYLANHSHLSRITAVLDGTKRKTTDLEKRVKDEEGRISALQQEGVDLKQKLEEETTELDKARSVYQDWLTRNSEKALERRLREAMDEKEQESERLLREFDPASEDLGSFIQEYIALRKSYHELYYKHEYFAQPNA